MADRVRSDNPAVRTVRGELVRRGGTRRPAVAIPTSAGEVLPSEGPVRLSLDETERRAAIDGDRQLITGAYDNDRLARERGGPDRLAEWVQERSIEFGRSVLVDVVEPGELYGLRLPGDEAVYEVRAGPDEALRRIAEDLDS